MRFSGTVPLPAPPERVWVNLIRPDLLSTCFPGIKSWQPLQKPHHFVLQLAPLAFPKANQLPAIQLRWDQLTPPQQLLLTAVIPLEQHPFEAHGTIDLIPTAAQETDLHFTTHIDTQSSMVETLVRQFAPRAIDTFFKNFIIYL